MMRSGYNTSLHPRWIFAWRRPSGIEGFQRSAPPSIPPPPPPPHPPRRLTSSILSNDACGRRAVYRAGTACGRGQSKDRQRRRKRDGSGREREKGRKIECEGTAVGQPIEQGANALRPGDRAAAHLAASVSSSISCRFRATAPFEDPCPGKPGHVDLSGQHARPPCRLSFDLPCFARWPGPEPTNQLTEK